VCSYLVAAFTDKKTLLVLAAANNSVLRAGRNVAKLAINTADAIKVFDVPERGCDRDEKGALETVQARYGAATAAEEAAAAEEEAAVEEGGSCC